MRLVTVGTGTVTPHARRTSAAHWVDVTAGSGERAGAGEPEDRGATPVGSGERSGSGGPRPTRDGPLPAPHSPPAPRSSVRLLLDCGAGTCHRMAGFGLPWFDLTHVAITHFHTDHYGELPALLFAMKYGAERPRSAPLTLIGPVGMRQRVAALAAAFGDWLAEPGFPLEVLEVRPAAAAVDLAPGVSLAACKTPHTDESLAYAIATAGARLVYTGDTGPSEPLGDWARPCDLLLAECSLPEDRALDFHLTPLGAGALAERAHAKRLVLTHLYPPVETTDILGQVARAYRGPAVVAADGDSFTVA